MQMTIINGIPDNSYKEFEDSLNKTAKSLSSQNEIDIYRVRDMDFHNCIGCFSCWVRTPGKCIFDDDMTGVLKKTYSSDLLIYVSPVSAGFLTSETKKAMERFLPLMLPYIDIYKKECHHLPRYEMHYKMGLILIRKNVVDLKSRRYIYDIFDRLAINMRINVPFKRTVTSGELGEVLKHEALYS